jgi:hypothetical protein
MITISKPELERITSNLDEYSQFIEKLSSFIEENAGAPIPCLKLTHAENASTFLFNPTLSEFVLGLSNLEIPASPPVSTSVIPPHSIPSILANNPFGSDQSLISNFERNASSHHSNTSDISYDESSVDTSLGSSSTRSNAQGTTVSSGVTRCSGRTRRVRRPKTLTEEQAITKAFNLLKEMGNISYRMHFDTLINSPNHLFNIYGRGGKDSPQFKWIRISRQIIRDDSPINISAPRAIHFFSFYVQTERLLALNPDIPDRATLYRSQSITSSKAIKSLNDAYLFGLRISKFAKACDEGEDNVKICGIPIPWTYIYNSADGWKKWSDAFNGLQLKETYSDQF